MNILFLTSAFPSSDYPKSNAHNYRSVLNISRIVQKIQVVHLRSWRPWRKFWKENKYDNINVWSFSFPYYPMLPNFILGLNLIIYKKILYHYFLKNKIKNFDLIHSVGVSMESIIGAYLSKKTNKKHIAQCMGGDVNQVLPSVRKYLGWKGFEHYVDIFTCNSNALKDTLLKMYPNKKALTVYRGVDLNEFVFNPINKNSFISNNTFIFLYLGGFITDNVNDKHNYKGGVSLLKAWKMIFKNAITHNKSVKLLFGGPNVNEQMVNKIIDTNSSDLNIKIIGQISIKDVKNLIDAASVVIIPSLSEGLPNVAMEAAAIGRPVIGSNVGGIPEIVLHNRTGLLFESGNIDELCKSINYYITNPELIKEHGKNARKLVEQKFDTIQFVRKYNGIYNDLKLQK